MYNYSFNNTKNTRIIFNTFLILIGYKHNFFPLNHWVYILILNRVSKLTVFLCRISVFVKFNWVKPLRVCQVWNSSYYYLQFVTISTIVWQKYDLVQFFKIKCGKNALILYSIWLISVVYDAKLLHVASFGPTLIHESAKALLCIKSLIHYYVFTVLTWS